MRIPRIYTPSELNVDSELTLEPEASQHIAKVLRMQVNDALTLFNGDGHAYDAIIVNAAKKSVSVKISQRNNEHCESPLAIHLGIAVSRGERMDWVVQKATELGATEITPLFTERTEVKLAGDRAVKKLRHWQQISISACQQCGRNRLPLLHPFEQVNTWQNEVNAERKYVLHHRALANGDDASDSASPASICLLIGPEGGLSEAEIAVAEQAGFQSLRLGPRVLRTETAPLAAIAILQSRWGDMAP